MATTLDDLDAFLRANMAGGPYEAPTGATTAGANPDMQGVADFVKSRRRALGPGGLSGMNADGETQNSLAELDAFLAQQKPTPRSDSSAMGDAGRAFMAGVGGVGQALGGLGEYAFDNSSSPMFQGAADAGKALRRSATGLSQQMVEGMSPEGQSRLGREWTNLGDQSIWRGGAGETASAIALQALQSLPSTLVTLVPGGLLMRAGSRAAVPFLAGSEATLTTGGVAGQIAQEIEQAKESELMQSDYYRQLRDQGYDDQTARQMLIPKAQGAAPLYAGAMTALVSGGAGKYLEPALMKEGMGLGQRIARGAIAEGPLQEAPQSWGEQVAANYAAGTWDKNRDLFQGAGEAAVQGGALGGIMGGGFAALGGRSPRSALPTDLPAGEVPPAQETPPPPAGPPGQMDLFPEDAAGATSPLQDRGAQLDLFTGKPVDPAVQAALGAAVAGEAPQQGDMLDQMPSSRPQQMDMFGQRPPVQGELPLDNPATARSGEQQDLFRDMPEQPSAEPATDLAAQLQELKDANSERSGVYLSADNLKRLSGGRAGLWLKRFMKGTVPVQNIDGKGGMVLFRDRVTAQTALDRLNAGEPLQQVLGEITGAGRGKTANPNAVAVQLLNEDGAVIREGMYSPEEANKVAEEWKADRPKGSVQIVPVQQALARRRQRVQLEDTSPEILSSEQQRMADEAALKREQETSPTETAKAAPLVGRLSAEDEAAVAELADNLLPNAVARGTDEKATKKGRARLDTRRQIQRFLQDLIRNYPADATDVRVLIGQVAEMVSRLRGTTLTPAQSRTASRRAAEAIFRLAQDASGRPEVADSAKKFLSVASRGKGLLRRLKTKSSLEGEPERAPYSRAELTALPDEQLQALYQEAQDYRQKSRVKPAFMAKLRDRAAQLRTQIAASPENRQALERRLTMIESRLNRLAERTTKTGDTEVIEAVSKDERMAAGKVGEDVSEIAREMSGAEKEPTRAEKVKEIIRYQIRRRASAEGGATRRSKLGRYSVAAAVGSTTTMREAAEMSEDRREAVASQHAAEKKVLDKHLKKVEKVIAKISEGEYGEIAKEPGTTLSFTTKGASLLMGKFWLQQLVAYGRMLQTTDTVSPSTVVAMQKLNEDLGAFLSTPDEKMGPALAGQAKRVKRLLQRAASRAGFPGKALDSAKLRRQIILRAREAELMNRFITAAQLNPFVSERILPLAYRIADAFAAHYAPDLQGRVTAEPFVYKMSDAENGLVHAYLQMRNMEPDARRVAKFLLRTTDYRVPAAIADPVLPSDATRPRPGETRSQWLKRRWAELKAEKEAGAQSKDAERQARAEETRRGIERRKMQRERVREMQAQRRAENFAKLKSEKYVAAREKLGNALDTLMSFSKSLLTADLRLEMNRSNLPTWAMSQQERQIRNDRIRARLNATRAYAEIGRAELDFLQGLAQLGLAKRAGAIGWRVNMGGKSFVYRPVGPQIASGKVTPDQAVKYITEKFPNEAPSLPRNTSARTISSKERMYARAAQRMQQILSDNALVDINDLFRELMPLLPEDSPAAFTIGKLLNIGMDVTVHRTAREELGSFYIDNGAQMIRVGLDQYATLMSRETDPRRQEILQGDMIVTLVHEAVHAATVGQLDKDAALRAEVRDLLKAAQEKGGDHYGIKNVYEFVAEAFSNRAFMSHLSMIKAPDGRTLWQKFMDFIRKVLGLAPTQQSETLLDAIFAKRGELFTGAPTERIDAQHMRVSDVVSNISENIKGADELRARAAAGLADVGADASRWSLKLLTMRQLQDFFGKHFTTPPAGNAFARYMDSWSRRNAKASSLTAEGNEVSRAWSELAGDQEMLMSELMTDATRWRVHPDLPLDHELNKHLKGDLQLKHAELAAKWQALDTATREVYTKAREYYQRVQEDHAKLALLNVLRRKLNDPSITKESIDLKTLASEEGLTKAYGDRLGEQVRSAVLRLARVPALQQGPYFPLARYGEHVVVAKGVTSTNTFDSMEDAEEFATAERKREPGVDVTVEPMQGVENKGKWQVHVLRREVVMTESRYEAEQERKRLVAQYGEENVSAVELKQEYTRDEPIIKDMSDLQAMLNLLQGNPGAQMAVQAFYLKGLSDHSYRKHQMVRTGVLGVNPHVQHRALANYVRSSSYYRAQLEYGYLMKDAMDSMYEFLRGRKDERVVSTERLQQVLSELRARDQMAADVHEIPKLVGKSAELSQFMLLLSPSYWMINASQPWMVSLPYLAARRGVVKSSRALTWAQGLIMHDLVRQGVTSAAGLRALTNKQVREDGFNIVSKLKQTISTRMGEEAKPYLDMLQELEDQRLLDFTQASELRELAEGGGSGAWDRVMDASRVMAHLTEVNNRVLVSLAAYKLARDQGRRHADAVNFAKDAVAKTQFDYTGPNNPRMFSPQNGAWRQIVFQFMKYPQHIYAMLLENYLLAKHGDKEAMKTLGGLFATHFTTAGLLGIALQPLKGAAMLLGLAFGSDDEPWDVDREIRRGAASLFGNELGEVVAAGLPRAVGVDLSQRFALGNLYYFDNLSRAEGRDLIGAAAQTFGGPTVGLAGSLLDSIQYMKNGDPGKAIEGVLPKALKDLLKAYRYSTEGVTTKQGDTILQAGDVPANQIFAQAIGFQPQAVSERQEQRGAIMDARGYDNKRREQLLQRFKRADAGSRGEIIREALEFNARNPDAEPIKISTLLRSVRPQGARTGMQAEYGVYEKGRGTGYLSRGDYTNVR